MRPYSTIIKAEKVQWRVKKPPKASLLKKTRHWIKLSLKGKNRVKERG